MNVSWPFLSLLAKYASLAQFEMLCNIVDHRIDLGELNGDAMAGNQLKMALITRTLKLMQTQCSQVMFI